MKKIIIVILVLITIMLSGCNDIQSRIDIITGNMFVFDDATVSIDKEYKFKDFSKEYKDNECIVTVRFNKR